MVAVTDALDKMEAKKSSSEVWSDRMKAHQAKFYGGCFADENGIGTTGMNGHPSKKIGRTF